MPFLLFDPGSAVAENPRQAGTPLFLRYRPGSHRASGMGELAEPDGVESCRPKRRDNQPAVGKLALVSTDGIRRARC